MKIVNALKLRQSLGKVLDGIRRTGKPVMIEKGRRPAAVIISLADFERRFVDVTAAEKRREIARQIREERERRRPDDGPSAVDLIRELRGPLL